MIEMWEVWIVGEENEREEEHVSGSSAKPGGMGVGRWKMRGWGGETERRGRVNQILATISTAGSTPTTTTTTLPTTPPSIPAVLQQNINVCLVFPAFFVTKPPNQVHPSLHPTFPSNTVMNRPAIVGQGYESILNLLPCHTGKANKLLMRFSSINNRIPSRTTQSTGGAFSVSINHTVLFRRRQNRVGLNSATCFK